MSDPSPTPSARQCVLALLRQGYSHAMIASMMDGCTSLRSVYRWEHGDSTPQNEFIYKTLLTKTCAALDMTPEALAKVKLPDTEEKGTAAK